jgi:hypothetical protein
MYWLVAFDSTHHALRAEAELEAAGYEIDIRPTPKSITAGCALSIDFLPQDFEHIQQLLAIKEIQVRGFFRPIGDVYEEISDVCFR